MGSTYGQRKVTVMVANNDSKTAKTQRLPREVRRRQLLQAAQQVFVSHGYHGASMDEIAEVALVSKPVLYQHFPGKRELYLALLDVHLEEFSALLDAAISSTDDNKQRVYATIDAYYEYIGHESQAFRLIFESDDKADPLIAERIARFNDRLTSSIAAVVISDTALNEDQGQLIGRALTGLFQVSARYWATSESSVSRDEAVELVSRLAWRGISKFPTENSLD